MALFLKSFELLKEYRGIKPFSMEFLDGLNVIVGENGSGKSSILHLMVGKSGAPKETYKIKCDSVDYRFLDTEKENPRLKDFNYSANPGFAIHSRFVSHGEAMLPVLMAAKEFKDTLLIVDEPEAGLSLLNQNKIYKAFSYITKDSCQIVITTHSYVIIQAAEKVFSLDEKKWITSKSYLKSVS